MKRMTTSARLIALAALNLPAHAERVAILRVADQHPVAVNIEVHGTWANAELQTFLQPILGTLGALGSKRFALSVTVTGDRHRASVAIGAVCGILCGSGDSRMYTFDSGQWKYLYTYDRWIS